MTAEAGDPVVRTERGPRGRVWLYAIAFVMLLVSCYLQVKGNINARLTLVWSSIGLSIAAALVAAAAVLVPGRRLRPAPRAAGEAKDAGPAEHVRAADDPSDGGDAEISDHDPGDGVGEEGRSPSDA